MFSTLIDPGASGVGVAFTDRQGGVSDAGLGPLNLGRTDADDVEHVRANFALVGARLGVSRFVTLHQVHGADVRVVDEAFLDDWGPSHHLGEPGGAPSLPVADALVTALPGVALVVRVADCVPVLLADRTSGVVGAAHAGRAGLSAGVLTTTYASMVGLGATDVEAWIGPHICGDCYEVPQAMLDDIARDHPSARAETSWGTPAIDLGAACASQLDALGVRVHRVDPCTRTTSTLHSFRRDAALAGRSAGIIWRVSTEQCSENRGHSGNLTLIQ